MQTMVSFKVLFYFFFLYVIKCIVYYIDRQLTFFYVTVNSYKLVLSVMLENFMQDKNQNEKKTVKNVILVFIIATKVKVNVKNVLLQPV